MEESEFSVSGFKKRKHGPRSDKGRKHNYPKQRKIYDSWSRKKCFVLANQNRASSGYQLPISLFQNCAREYVPMKKEDHLIAVPIVKSVAGVDLTIVSESQKNIYREIDEEMKKDANNQRERW